MPDEILVVEYEPRYVERVKQALKGQPVEALFARDGEEALRAIGLSQPRLIVLSSIIPKISTGELIRQMRTLLGDELPPILVTISGYSGKTPKLDAGKMGASDILPKPYSEAEFLARVRQILGMEGSPAESSAAWPSGIVEEFSVPEPKKRADLRETSRMTAEALVEDLRKEGKAADSSPRKQRTSEADIDRMLAETLTGVRIPSAGKKNPAATSSASRQGTPLPDLDKLLDDTLSGLEARIKRKQAASASLQPPPAGSEERSAAAGVGADPSPDEPGDPGEGIRFGQYLLVEKIAAGGMAEVWKARMRGVEGFQKIVAIKKILSHLSDNSEFVDMFIDEAKLAAQLNHSNIIHIYDLGKIAKSYYIAMEYVEGHDLRSILRTAADRDSPLPPELALFITSKVAAALDYAHRKRDFDDNEMELVHRDVSPQNILISYEGDIKLCDFGIAKAASKASHTLSGALKGKLQYMSPEQAWGRKIDRRSDIFALGTVLFELLTGRRLFSGDSELSVLEQVRQAKTVAPSTYNDEVPPEVDAIVLRALQPELENRYQTAGEMAKDLDSVIYDFSPTPSSADLAIYMHHLYDEPAEHAEAAPPGPTALPMDEPEPEDGELIIPAPVGVPSAPPEAPMVREPLSYGSTSSKRRLPMVAIAAAVILISGLALGGYYVFRNREAGGGAAPASSQSTAPGVTPPVNESAPTQVASAAFTDPSPPPIVAGTPAIDQAMIDEEVQRRLEAEKQRLEAQRQAQDGTGRTPPQASSSPDRAAPGTRPAPAAQATTPVAEATPLPAPSATPAPTIVPTPTATPPPTPTEEPKPAATVAQAPTPRVYREGELVAAGTDGLTPPTIVRQFRPPYPPLAKMQRVEGIVVLQVLVSEEGKVMDVKILRGVSPDVGINDAAVDAVRRSTFAPGSINGVKVKAYKTLTIPFKL